MMQTDMPYDWLAMLLSLVALWQLGRQNKQGFLLFMVANLFWLGFAVAQTNLPIFIGNIAFLLVNLNNYRQALRIERRVVQ